MVKRCVNIDWLEVYCLESAANYPCNAEFFRSKGYSVLEREYGTRQYREMFTILDKDNLAFIEVRRNPVADKAAQTRGMFCPQSTHIKLANRYCYLDNAVQLFSEFLNSFDYTIERLYRIDICMDFEKFDKGDDPHRFLQRYMAGRYTKINQCNLSAHAADRWDTRDWNSASWGSAMSMVSTKIYNKTKELAEVKDKPYIRYAWFVSHLIDDFNTCEKVGEDGKKYHPNIWRVEFSIKSSARGWFVCEDNNNSKTKVLKKEHTLATYRTRQDLLEAFAMLAHHYFHFKVYEPEVRKDRCKDKVLFDFSLNHVPYKLDTLLTAKPQDSALKVLLKKLQAYKWRTTKPEVNRAIDLLIDDLHRIMTVESTSEYYDVTEARLLQMLLSKRMQHIGDESFEEDYNILKQILETSDIF